MKRSSCLDGALSLLGCWGGWIFTEGKYAEEFGFIDESCNPYSAEDEHCERDASPCQRYYGTNYQYIGGYFGGYVNTRLLTHPTPLSSLRTLRPLSRYISSLNRRYRSPLLHDVTTSTDNFCLKHRRTYCNVIFFLLFV